ncbi:MAG: phenylalanine--tRNA ligase subunit alpha [Clostridiales bacterium]|nr:phenylalanine--tRNA ligase subunit alpha [Clostridiales bacterium]
MEEIEKLNIEILEEIKEIKSLTDLEEFKVKFLGKKSKIIDLMKNIKNIKEINNKKKFGQKINDLKNKIELLINDKYCELNLAFIEQKLRDENIDITLPGNKINFGNLHPISYILNEIIDIFVSMGYRVIDSHEIENTYYNFDALNIPKAHPARDENDTFYFDNDHVLVTATSPMQVHVMENNNPPIKIVSPGKVYRFDEIDSTHTPMFNQIEGLLVDKNISMKDLKGTLDFFVKKLIDKNVKTRFRPHYFPFTEPSAEMDVTCFACNGKGCKICKNSGFIELLGCGMVHPNVLEKVNIDSDKFSGFAFGIGIERIAMLKYQIDDIRLFYENNLKFLEQFYA